MFIRKCIEENENWIFLLCQIDNLHWDHHTALWGLWTKTYRPVGSCQQVSWGPHAKWCKTNFPGNNRVFPRKDLDFIILNVGHKTLFFQVFLFPFYHHFHHKPFFSFLTRWFIHAKSIDFRDAPFLHVNTLHWGLGQIQLGKLGPSSWHHAYLWHILQDYLYFLSCFCPSLKWQSPQQL